MTDPILNAQRLISSTLAVVALIGWGAYAYSEHAAAARDQDHNETLTRVTSDREDLFSNNNRLRQELRDAQMQLVATRQELASLQLQHKVTETASVGQQQPAFATRKDGSEHSGKRPLIR